MSTVLSSRNLKSFAQITTLQKLKPSFQRTIISVLDLVSSEHVTIPYPYSFSSRFFPVPILCLYTTKTFKPTFPRAFRQNFWNERWLNFSICCKVRSLWRLLDFFFPISNTRFLHLYLSWRTGITIGWIDVKESCQTWRKSHGHSSKAVCLHCFEPPWNREDFLNRAFSFK